MPDPSPYCLDGLSELKSLVGIIQTCVDTIEDAVKSNSLDFPSSSTPFTLQSEAARNLPEVLQAGSLLVAAATQLVSVARPPAVSAAIAAFQHILSAALRVAVEANVVEAIREAGLQGAHVNDIARASNIDPSKLARVMRLLATNHIFVETAPDVFANNRVSSVIDTEKSVQSLRDRPEMKYVETNGIAAGIGHTTDEAFKASSYLSEVLLDPKSGKSDEPIETAFNKAFNCRGTLWDWLDSPENAGSLVRFGMAMEGGKRASPPDAILHGFDWNGLKSGALVVDVGGGIGSQSIVLAKHCSHIQIVVQDREAVVKDASKFWEAQLPDAISSKRVILQAHDFFTSQPINKPDVFLLRMILHDWPDKYCVKILRHLREAAAPSTRLVVIDNLVSYACPEDCVKDIPGAAIPLPPAPLLPNLGQANVVRYYRDVQMMELLNGKERTITQMRELMQEAGWKLVDIHHGVPSAFSIQKVIAVPV